MNNLLHASPVHASWLPILKPALQKVQPTYLENLLLDSDWLPGKQNIFNAFTQPVQNVRYILLGESPYPRAASANGYAFWDARVGSLWSPQGLSATVNRATSLRNFLKMLLVARGELKTDTSQSAIASLDHSHHVSTLSELFENLLAHGFLLLNASLVLSNQAVKLDAKQWEPFLSTIFNWLIENQPIRFLLFGKIASQILPLLPPEQDILLAEHPYNLSFIHNKTVLDFFRPLDLLSPQDKP